MIKINGQKPQSECHVKRMCSFEKKRNQQALTHDFSMIFKLKRFFFTEKNFLVGDVSYMLVQWLDPIKNKVENVPIKSVQHWNACGNHMNFSFEYFIAQI